jgi:hydrogenase-4 component E
MEHIGFGALSYDFAHLLGGLMLLLSFTLLTQRRLAATINIYAVQALILALAACWQGYVQHEPSLYLTGAIAFAAKAVIIPLMLRRFVRRLHLSASMEPALGIFASMALGVALVALSIMVVLPTTIQAQALTREDLALALSVVLLGLLMMITRRTAFTQVIGFMSLENGLILAAVGVAGMPLVVELSVAVLILVAFVVFGVFLRRMRVQFHSLDTAHFDRVGSMHR